jgi:hypothetical protein
MTKMEEWKKAVFAGQIVLGLALAVMPWLAGFTGETAAWTAWITGAAMALVAVAAFFGHALVASWVNLVAGIWAVVAPWLIGFAMIALAMWSHVAIGLLVAGAAAIALWREYQPGRTAHA